MGKRQQIAVVLLSWYLAIFFIPCLAADPVELKPFVMHLKGVQGKAIRLLDQKTMEIDEFFYDGTGPAAHFMVGNQDFWSDKCVSLNGTLIPDENGSCKVLGAYNKKNIKLILPGDMKWSDMNYLSVFCTKADVNFGSVGIQGDLSALPDGAANTLKPCVRTKFPNMTDIPGMGASGSGINSGGTLLGALGIIYTLYNI